MGRVPDNFFNEMYAISDDPWQLAQRWYEQRKYAITMAMLPRLRYRHVFEPGCSMGVLTEQLAARCEWVTAIDLVGSALESARARIARRGLSDRVSFHRQSLDSRWPAEDFDLVVLSEVAYYLDAAMLRDVLDRELGQMREGTTILAAHWRHAVAEYPLTGDEANRLIGATVGLHHAAGYRDDDVAIDVFVIGQVPSVAAATGVPGAGS
ncbi:Nodulation protein S (NodS) [Mycolicibacterium phlei]|nr:SAM-dependent methyltransferase [Mycobacteroides chelonae]VEG19789.1 Nodulation protein S (NodS) [Mycolicibacterium phlei]AKC40257.1 SAM-dependent methlyltransferase [Mycobacteroides chelonae]ANA99871.1 SAM-dependent methlyltransferase [Mycobacteroides chelonae CCUG 47445]OLT82335.1 SAM-dependent methyltransferase [Mycobacteroides chelonae]ORV15895.1 SAM-dependent methyltransferase [Mycobacteroides chelonae]